MAKTPPERLAAALKANLKRRKQLPPSGPRPDPVKDPEKLKENPPDSASRQRPGP